MLSILIPTYNYNTLLLVKTLQQQAIESKVVFEILALDDASTDKQCSAENKKINALDHCSFLENEKNIGRTATRNILAKKAKYDWLLFLDADVIPLNENYIATYTKELDNKHDVISGGIVYKGQRPEHKQLLRWVYGRKRESKSAKARNKKPYNIISANLLIDKKLFLNANNFETNQYGLDIYFSYKIRELKAKVLHIENPTIHLGLESTAVFLEKSLHAIQTTHILEKDKKIDTASRALQIRYNQLNSTGATKLFIFIFSGLEKKIIKNLNSTNPSIFLFDLYKLCYYCKLMKNA
ncbi:glycosyltransferase [Flavobacteriaceae bacterium]|nr:glycosyltransferase [Flavobacteriaceae bacterium]